MHSPAQPVEEVVHAPTNSSGMRSQCLQHYSNQIESSSLLHNGYYTCRVTTSGGMTATSTNTVAIIVDCKLTSNICELELSLHISFTVPVISAAISGSGSSGFPLEGSSGFPLEGSSGFPLEGREYTITCTVSGHQSLIPSSVNYHGSENLALCKGKELTTD